MVEKIEVNLLPAEYRVHSVKIKFHKEVVIPSIVSAVVFLALFVVTMWLNTQIGSYNRKIAQVEADILKNQHILDEINSLKQQKATVIKKIRALERIDVNREKWIRLMEVFSQQLPQGSWIEEMKENKDVATKIDTIAVSGRTYSFSEVAQYMMRLKRSEFINEVDLQNIEQLSNTSRIYKFVVKCYLNPDAKLGKLEKKVSN